LESWSGQHFKRQLLEAGCETLCSLGYKPSISIPFRRRALLCRIARASRKELEEMFVRDEVRAILSARGGYGSNYLLDLLDLQKIKLIPRSLSATATSRRF